MEIIKLTISDSINLLYELEGVKDQNTGDVLFKGFCDQKISLKEKYWISKVVDFLKKEQERVEKMKNELIKKYGVEQDGTVTIPMFIEEKENPNYVKFVEEYQELLKEEIEIKYRPISLSSLENINTEEKYEILFKLVLEDETI